MPAPGVVGYAAVQIIASAKGLGAQLDKLVLGPAKTTGLNAGKALGEQLGLGAKDAGSKTGALIAEGLAPALAKAGRDGASKLADAYQARQGAFERIAVAQRAAADAAGKLRVQESKLSAVLADSAATEQQKELATQKRDAALDRHTQTLAAVTKAEEEHAAASEMWEQAGAKTRTPLGRAGAFAARLSPGPQPGAAQLAAEAEAAARRLARAEDEATGASRRHKLAEAQLADAMADSKTKAEQLAAAEEKRDAADRARLAALRQRAVAEREHTLLAQRAALAQEEAARRENSLLSRAGRAVGAGFDLVPDSLSRALGLARVRAGDEAGRIGATIADKTGEAFRLKARQLTGIGAAAVAGLVGYKAFSAGLERLTTIEDATTSLKTIMGDQAKAADLMNKIKETVQGTPFTLDQFATAGKNLVAMNVEAVKVPHILTAIGEAAAASGKGAEGVSRVVDAFGKMAAQGKVQLDNVWSISDAGVPALQILANGFGVTTDEMQKMISKGAVPATKAIDVLTEGILKGSQGAAGATRGYAGTMAGLRQTFSGAKGGLKASVARFGAAGLGPLMPSFTQIMGSTATSLDALAPKLQAVSQRLADSGALQRFSALIARLPSLIGAASSKAGELWRKLTGSEDGKRTLGDVHELVAKLAPKLRETALAAVKIGAAFAQAAAAVGVGTWQILLTTLEAVSPLLTTVLAPALAGVADFLAKHQALTQTVITGYLGIRAATQAWALGQQALNAVMNASPFMRLVAILSVVVGAVVYAYQHNQRFHDICVAAWHGIAQAASWAWQNVIKPTVDFLVAAYKDYLAPAALWLWKEVLVPAWQGIAQACQWAWENVIKPTWDALGKAVDWLGGVFTGLKDIATSVWDGIVAVFKRGAVLLGQLLQEVQIPDWVPAVGGMGLKGLGDDLVNWGQGKADGGLVRGPGGPREDRVPILASNGEFVVNARAAAQNLPLLQSINNGQNPDLPRYADGGLVGPDRLAQVADSMVGAPYVRGGHSRAGVDCSGLMAVLANAAVGLDPWATRFFTGNEAAELQKRGFILGQGPPGTFRIGWRNGGPGGGHSAGTLPDGRNAESGGNHGKVLVGAGAAGADDPYFDQHAYLPPQAMYPDGPAGGGGGSFPFGSVGSGAGGSLGSGATGGGGAQAQLQRAQAAEDRASGQVAKAQDRESDATSRLALAKQRLKEVEADPKAKESQKLAARQSVEKAERDLQEAGAAKKAAQDQLQAAGEHRRLIQERPDLYGAGTGSAAQAQIQRAQQAETRAGEQVAKANDREQDSANRLALAKQRLQEVEANPKAKESQKLAARQSVEKAQREVDEAKAAKKQAEDKLGQTRAAREELEANPPPDKAKKTNGKGSGPGGEDFGKQLGSGLLQMVGLDGSILDNPMEWGGVKWLTGLINSFTKPAEGQTGAAGSPLGYGQGVGADALPGIGGEIALPGFDPGALGSLPGLSPQAPAAPQLGADGATASPDVAASLQQAPDPTGAGAGQAGPTTVDQSIRFNGPVGQDHNAVVNQVQSAFNTRNRAVNLTVGRQA